MFYGELTQNVWHLLSYFSCRLLLDMDLKSKHIFMKFRI